MPASVSLPDIDRIAQEFVQHITALKAREKTQLEFISSMYTDNMVKILANPRFIPVQELHTHHEEVIQTCLEAVSKVKALSTKQKGRVRDHLAKLYEDFKKTNEKKLQTKAPAIGIDLGTTYCCVAYFNKDSGEVEVVPNELGENTTASYVQLNADNEIVVGNTAKDLAHLNPKGTIFDIKRMCGRHFEDEEIQKLKKYWPFQVVQGEDGKIKIRLGQEILYPEEVLVNLVNHLKKITEEYLNEMVVNAVVTIPAYFSPRQKTLTNEACNKAGLNIIRLISEPAAAAVAYGVHLQNQAGKRRGLIFDLGGGTFDVAILELENKKIKILATDGDPYLGGEDFDNSLMQHCVDAFRKENEVDLMDTGNDVERSMRLKRMKTECEKQKCYLSSTKKVKISIDSIWDQKALTVSVTRDELSDLFKPYVDRCMKVVDQILANCGLKEPDIDDVMVVGGSTRIPYVQERLSEKFGGKKLIKRISQEEAVAHGAAIVAHNIENELDIIVQELEQKL